VLTSNMFGDILSDEAAVLAGSIGLLPSASVGTGPGFYEPIHGSAPDIAGRGIANPIGAIASAAEMLRRSLGMPEIADKIDVAIDKVLDEGRRTADLGGTVSTEQMGGFVCQALERLFENSRVNPCPPKSGRPFASMLLPSPCAAPAFSSNACSRKAPIPFSAIREAPSSTFTTSSPR